MDLYKRFLRGVDWGFEDKRASSRIACFFEPNTLFMDDLYKRYFPGTDWSISSGKASAVIGCFVVLVEGRIDGYRALVSCFAGATTVPIWSSTDIGGQSLEAALKAVWLWCGEQGNEMVKAVGVPPRATL